MAVSGSEREFGMGRGRVFPEDQARSLVNPARRLVQSPRRTVARMDLEPQANVLEIGCGPGFFSAHLSRAVPGGQLVLMDLQSRMVVLARERLSPASNVRYTQGDAMALPFESGRFDAVLLATMLGEVPDRTACIEEVRRVLRPGGSVVVAETRRDSDFIPLKEARELLEELGLAYIDRGGISWQYTAKFCKA